MTRRCRMERASTAPARCFSRSQSGYPRRSLVPSAQALRGPAPRLVPPPTTTPTPPALRLPLPPAVPGMRADVAYLPRRRCTSQMYRGYVAHVSPAYGPSCRVRQRFPSLSESFRVFPSLAESTRPDALRFRPRIHLAPVSSESQSESLSESNSESPPQHHAVPFTIAAPHRRRVPALTTRSAHPANRPPPHPHRAAISIPRRAPHHRTCRRPHGEVYSRRQASGAAMASASAARTSS
jgi:hypothetical protein